MYASGSKSTVHPYLGRQAVLCFRPARSSFQGEFFDRVTTTLAKDHLEGLGAVIRDETEPLPAPTPSTSAATVINEADEDELFGAEVVPEAQVSCIVC